MKTKNLLFILLALGLFSQVDAQAIKVQACARTTDVNPVKDNNGNDRRHLSAFRLDSITIKEFGTANPVVFARIGVDGQMEWNSGVWVNGCTGYSGTNCNGCNKCEAPTFTDGMPGGRVFGDIENNVRVKTENNDLIIEATNEKDVCYETPWINAPQARGKFAYIEVGYNGTTTDNDTRTMNIKLNYILLQDDGTVHNFMNKWSNFEQAQVQRIRTISTLTSANDLENAVSLTLAPNPVENVLRLDFSSEETLDLDMEIISTAGSSIVRKRSQIQSGQDSLTLNVADLTTGTYFLVLTDHNNRQLTQQFVKK